MAEQPQAAPLLELAERAERVSVPLRCPSWRASPSARRRVAAAKSRPADAAACRRRVAAAGDSERHSLHGRRSSDRRGRPLGLRLCRNRRGPIHAADQCRKATPLAPAPCRSTPDRGENRHHAGAAAFDERPDQRVGLVLKRRRATALHQAQGKFLEGMRRYTEDKDEAREGRTPPSRRLARGASGHDRERLSASANHRGVRMTGREAGRA